MITVVGKYTEQADADVSMTDEESLKHLDLARLATIMQSPVMINLRQIYPAEKAERQGFVVETIGRTDMEPHPISTYLPEFLITDIAAHTHSSALSVNHKGEKVSRIVIPRLDLDQNRTEISEVVGYFVLGKIINRTKEHDYA